jgi:hypothetical protein
VTEIGASAFCETHFSGILIFPENLSSIGEMAFKNCSSLVSIVVTCQKILSKAFFGCDSLSVAYLSVSSFGDESFASCPKLENITFLKAFTYSQSVFNNSNVKRVFYNSSTIVTGAQPFSIKPNFTFLHYPNDTFMGYKVNDSPPEKSIISFILCFLVGFLIILFLSFFLSTFIIQCS